MADTDLAEHAKAAARGMYLITGRTPARPPHWPGGASETGIGYAATADVAVAMADLARQDGWTEVVIYEP